MSAKITNILIEGEEYDFKVLKIITLYDGNKYFVIEGPNLNKYLLNCSLYKNYNININDEIKCKVDKINCSGRTFLEPKHPFLVEGEIYNFEVIAIEELITEEDDNEQTLILKDEHNFEYIALLDEKVSLKELSKNIKVRIKKISKARLFLDIIS